MTEDQNMPPDQTEEVHQEKAAEHISPAENIEQLQTATTKAETDNMEVHVHPHNAMHKKNWKEYTLDFFMLFLAVTLGFFAEGYREYLNDRHKEKEYMVALLEDVRNDSTALITTAKQIEEQDKGLDSLIAVLRQPLSGKKNLQLAYVLYLKYGDVYSHVFFSEGSISQMINSGGLRIVRSSDMVRLINEYQNIKMLVRKDEDDVRKLEGEIERGQANHIFDFTTSSILDRVEDTATADIPIGALMKLADESTIDLIGNDPALIAAFRNNLNSYKTFIEDYLFWIQGTVTINSNMLAALREEYGARH
jgi:hypothetical protein